MSWRPKPFGEILIQKGLITPKQLESALAEQAMTKEFLGIIFLKRKWIKEKDLLEVLSEQFNLPVVDLKNRYIDWKIVKDFSPSLILDCHCFPFERNAGSVTMAITNPLDLWNLKKAEDEAKGLKLKLALTSQEDMNDAVERYRLYIQRYLPKLLD